MLKIDSLTDVDREELGKLPFGDSFEPNLYLWARDVGLLECDEGYVGNDYDYGHTLWNRDALEACIAQATPGLALKLRSAVEPFDKRFRVATRQHTNPNELEAPYGGEPPYPGFPAWWWSRWASKTDRRTANERRSDHKAGKMYYGEAMMHKADDAIVERLIPIVRRLAASGEPPTRILRRIQTESGNSDAWPISYWVWRRGFNIDPYFAHKSRLWRGFAEGGAVDDSEIDDLLGPSVSAYVVGATPPEPPENAT